MAKKNKPQTILPRHSVRENLNGLFQALRAWVHDLLDLRSGMDRQGAIKAIKTGRQMHGASAWMLMCSIMIASLGLDLGSPAVIIGAMLISPLMSPILGIGLAVGINDREALAFSLRHFGIAILIALTTSTLYFLITPLGQITEEISARTAPTFLDGLVAVFGGLAGIISMTRKDQSNAIPGVAIATALMPPLCVTGFGLAKGDMQIALNSFYLFFLNSFFIALTTYFIIRLLNFPYRAHVNEREHKRTRWMITAFSLLVIVPSAFILKSVMDDLRDKQNVKAFVQDYFPKDCLSYRLFEPSIPKKERPGFFKQMTTLLTEESPAETDSISRSNPKPEPKTLVLQMIGRVIPQDSFKHYQQIMQNEYFIEHTRFLAIPDYSIELKNFDQRLQGRLTGQLDQILDSLSITQTRQMLETRHLRTRSDSLRSDSILFANLTQDVQLLYEGIKNIRFSKAQITGSDQPFGSRPLLIIKWQDPRQRPENYRENLLQLYTKKAKLDTLEIIDL